MNLTTDGVTMNHIVKKILFVTTIFLAVIFVVSCASIPKDIPLELSAKELNQKAQECTAVENYAGAEVYYKTLIQRYGMDTSVLIPAEFELAHVYIKQKKYDKTKPLLEKVLSYYEVDATNLPREYKKLAQIDLNKIPKEELETSQEKNN